MHSLKRKMKEGLWGVVNILFLTWLVVPWVFALWWFIELYIHILCTSLYEFSLTIIRDLKGKWKKWKKSQKPLPSTRERCNAVTFCCCCCFLLKSWIKLGNWFLNLLVIPSLYMDTVLCHKEGLTLIEKWCNFMDLKPHPNGWLISRSLPQDGETHHSISSSSRSS